MSVFFLDRRNNINVRIHFDDVTVGIVEEELKRTIGTRGGATELGDAFGGQFRFGGVGVVYQQGEMVMAAGGGRHVRIGDQVQLLAAEGIPCAGEIKGFVEVIK